MKFIKIIFWEYIQNLPIIAGFVAAFGQWQNGKYLPASLYIVGGSVAAAILIFVTEVRKQDGYKEPRIVLLANMIGMTAIMLLMVIYFGAHWGNWISDLVLGVMVGVGLGMVQSLTAKKPINWIHCIALGIASPLILISIREFLHTTWPLWLHILLVCSLATLIISVIDYLPDTLSSEK